MKTVQADQLSTLRMVAGGERKHPIVIDRGVVKRWVGFGWIEENRATHSDRRKYPRVVRTP